MVYRNEQVSITVPINAPASVVWLYLTVPDKMITWMKDTHMELEVYSDWQIGSVIKLRGNLHGIPFENNGTILKNDPEKTLQYTHRSSLSELPDEPENYCVLTFVLSQKNNETELNLTIINFPTESIFKHLRFYWTSALQILKWQVDSGARA